jgi:hypothetical protein
MIRVHSRRHSPRRKSQSGLNLRLRRNHLTSIEQLEARCLLATDPIISEIQAANVSTLADGDGDFSDWIEVRNPGAESIDLQGWYLTDDRTDLRKWQFPAVSLQPASQLVVFASNKDRRDASQELHTNFRLAAAGEFLALVKPDGVTVAQQFDPGYPAQTDDLSYGTAFERDSVELLAKSAAAKAMVPTDDSLGLNWTAAQFDDSAWLSGKMGVGYEQVSEPKVMRQEFDAPLGADWTIDVPQGSAGTVTVADGALKFVVPLRHDTGDTRGLAPMVLHATPTNTLNWEVIAHVQRSVSRGGAGIAIFDAATGKSVLQHEYSQRTTFGTYVNGQAAATRRVSGRDTFFLRLVRDSSEGSWTTSYKNNADDNWTELATILDDDENVPNAAQPRIGIYTRTTTSQMEADFGFVEINDLGRPVIYGPHTGLDVGSAMLNRNSSVYVRVPFSVTGDPRRFDEMFMTSSFDDGFRAYINGVPVAERNVPIDATWNSGASSREGAVRGEIPVHRINLSPFVHALRTGRNVLAIHGMNVSASDVDFFVSTELVAADYVSSSPRFFTSPTPGDVNLLPAAPQPRISGGDALFFESKTIELSLDQPDPALEIHYTLDGTAPTLESARYEGPITLTETAMLQAVTFDISGGGRFEASAPASGTFIRLHEELRDQTSDLPLVILDTLGRGIPGSGSNQLRSVDVAFFDVDKATGRSSFQGIVDYLGRGGIRDRGSSTAGQPKPNLAFETWGKRGIDVDDDESVSLLGFAAANNWVLHAPYEFDRALIRNQFAYSLSNQIGRWAPRTQPVEVYLNRRDGTVGPEDYAGVYVLMERIEPDPGRLDIATLTPADNTEPNVSGGYIWKFDREDPDAPGFSAGGQTLQWVYPKSPRSRTARPEQMATAEQERWVQDYLGDFNRTLSRPNITDPDGYSKYIDVDSWVDHHLLNVLMDNVDAFVLSAYVFKNRDKKVEMGPLWDFDRSMESTDDRDNDPTRWGGSGSSDFFARVWWGRLFTDRGFWQAYVDRWRELRQTDFSDANIDATLDRMAAQVAEAQPRNTAKWPATRSRYGDWKGEVEHMREWLHQRTAFIDSMFAPDPVIVANGQT